MKRWHKRVAMGLPAALLVVLAGGLWSASSSLLFPSFHGATRDLAVCPAEAEKAWGPSCGNLRATHALAFTEVQVPSLNGYDMPGWLMAAAANGGPAATGAIVLVHGGGSDRREMTRHARFFLGRGLDVLTLDLGCSGEAPCPVPGQSYGARESRDVVSAYLYLSARYPHVLAMGSSVGAAALLIALPEMPRLEGAIAENPMASFERLVREFPGAQSSPRWFMGGMLGLAELRGHFDGLASAEHSLRVGATTPLYFVHGRQDQVVSFHQTEDLVALYPGPKTAWYPDAGAHGALREADPAEYERRLAAFLGSVRH